MEEAEQRGLFDLLDPRTQSVIRKCRDTDTTYKDLRRDAHKTTANGVRHFVRKGLQRMWGAAPDLHDRFQLEEVINLKHWHLSPSAAAPLLTAQEIQTFRIETRLIRTRYARRLHEDPGIVARQRERVREANRGPEHSAQGREAALRLWNDPILRAARMERNSFRTIRVGQSAYRKLLAMRGVTEIDTYSNLSFLRYAPDKVPPARPNNKTDLANTIRRAEKAFGRLQEKYQHLIANFDPGIADLVQSLLDRALSSYEVRSGKGFGEFFEDYIRVSGIDAAHYTYAARLRAFDLRLAQLQRRVAEDPSITVQPSVAVQPEAREIVTRKPLLSAELEREFAGHYDKFYPKILSYLRYHIGNPEDAMDLAQQTFLNAYNNFASFREREGSTVSSWLYRIAHNLFVDRYRRIEKENETVLEEADKVADKTSLEESTIKAVDELRVRDAMMRLTEDQRDILILRVFCQLDLAETGKISSKSEDAVKQLQSRALSALGRILEAEGYGSPALGKHPGRPTFFKNR